MALLGPVLSELAQIYIKIMRQETALQVSLMQMTLSVAQEAERLGLQAGEHRKEALLDQASGQFASALCTIVGGAVSIGMSVAFALQHAAESNKAIKAASQEQLKSQFDGRPATTPFTAPDGTVTQTRGDIVLRNGMYINTSGESALSLKDQAVISQKATAGSDAAKDIATKAVDTITQGTSQMLQCAMTSKQAQAEYDAAAAEQVSQFMQAMLKQIQESAQAAGSSKDAADQAVKDLAQKIETLSRPISAGA